MPLKKEELIIIPPRDMFVGKSDAPVLLMEFGEYENEECAKANEVVKQLLQDYDGKIRFQFRHFPLTLIHQRSLKASEAAVAAGQEGKFWEMHNVLFQNRRTLGTTSLKLHSKEAGVKSRIFLDDLVNGTFGWQVQDDIKVGRDMGVKDPPTFFVNGVMVTGKPTYANISAAIDQALKPSRAKAPARTKSKVKPKPKPRSKPKPAKAKPKKATKPVKKKKK
jgi:protein-disulfide isomerase